MNKPTLREYLDGVREECNAATEGPWAWRGTVHDYYLSRAGDAETFGIEDAIVRASDDHVVVGRGDRALIAHSRTNVEVLLNMVEAVYDEAALRKRLEDLVPEGEA